MKNIKNWGITGDTHGQFSRFSHLGEEFQSPENAIIILGDAGFNMNKPTQDRGVKKGYTKKNKFITYCLRGNHEARPQDCKDIVKIYDEEVENYVYIDPEYPTIRFLLDYGIYQFGNYKCLCIGGAYSVDKYYRLMMGWPWYYNEQLTSEEMEECKELAQGQEFDFILSHTCPYSFQPTDLFLGSIDQSTVDNTMEHWLDEIVNCCSWKYYLFGHYHADRIELPHVEQFYNEIENIEDIVARWSKYDTTGELDWWLPLAPRMERLMSERNCE